MICEEVQEMIKKAHFHAEKEDLKMGAETQDKARLEADVKIVKKHFIGNAKNLNKLIEALRGEKK